jgi:hypothetical protein
MNLKALVVNVIILLFFLQFTFVVVSQKKKPVKKALQRVGIVEDNSLTMPEIKDFAFVFLTGILVGTYSSIYIASAVLLTWNKGERPRLGAGSSVRVENPITTPSSPSPVRS